MFFRILVYSLIVRLSDSSDRLIIDEREDLQSNGSMSSSSRHWQEKQEYSSCCRLDDIPDESLHAISLGRVVIDFSIKTGDKIIVFDDHSIEKSTFNRADIYLSIKKPNQSQESEVTNTTSIETKQHGENEDNKALVSLKRKRTSTKPFQKNDTSQAKKPCKSQNTKLNKTNDVQPLYDSRLLVSKAVELNKKYSDFQSKEIKHLKDKTNIQKQISCGSEISAETSFFTFLKKISFLEGFELKKEFSRNTTESFIYFISLNYQRLCLGISFLNVITHIESEHGFIFQGLLFFCLKINNKNSKFLEKKDSIKKFINILHNGPIIQNINFIDKRNFLSNEESSLSEYKDYIPGYNKYFKKFLETMNILDTPGDESYLRCQISIFLEKTHNETLYRNIAVLSKLILRFIKSKDFKILLRLIPELESIMDLVSNSKGFFIRLKHIHFLLGFIVYKFYFLKENIKKEISDNKQSDYYLDSPLLETFITEVQTLLLIVLNKSQITFKDNTTFKILLFKNFLNYISVRNIYSEGNRNHLFISFIHEQHFSSIKFENYITFDNNESVYWHSILGSKDLQGISCDEKSKYNLKSILNIQDSKVIESVFNEVKASIAEIQKIIFQLK